MKSNIGQGKMKRDGYLHRAEVAANLRGAGVESLGGDEMVREPVW